MSADDAAIYRDLAFPEAPAHRPYVFVNMVTTIDGKTVSGDRSEDVLDLGSRVDHALMRKIEDQADAVIVGASTLRAASPKWDPATDFRVVVSNSGIFDYRLPFFTSGGRSFVACSESADFKTGAGVNRLETGRGDVEFGFLFRKLREMGSRRLLCLGGSNLNGQLLERNLVDELFWTIAPKVKLGEGLPTYAGGHPLPRDKMLRFNLIEHHVVGDEVFLRYRREPAR